MKTRILFLIATAAVAAACAKTEPVESIAISGECVFTANVEEQQTKTELNEGATGLLWVAGDKVKIYGSTANAIYTASTPGSSTTLTGDSVGAAPYAAYYPADYASAWDSDDKKFTVSFPATQTYVAGNIADKSYPMIGYIESGTGFSFKNVGGLVCVKVKAAYDNIYVQSIKITAPSAISGAATVAWNDGTPVVTMTGTADADKVVTLDCSAAADNKGVLINSSSYVPFYITIPAGDYTGIQVTVTGSIQDKAYTASQTLTNSNEVEVVRSSKTSFQMTAANIIFDLSQQAGHPNETANTYLIKEPGKYKFPVTEKGNGVIAPNSGISVSTIDASSILSSGIYYTDGTSPVDGSITVADGYATFATSTTLVAGNALFGIFSSATGTPAENVKGNCIWSWDIWANPTVKEVTSGSYTFLSCHLGAHQDGFVGNDGYFYQWGRKDPFPQSGSLSGVYVQAGAVEATITGAIQNPTHWYESSTNGTGSSSSSYTWDWLEESKANLWDTDNNNKEDDDVDKTMFDPCPVGYHVPSYKALASIASNSTQSPITSNCIWYGITGSYTVQWPACGYRFYATGSLHARGLDGDGGFRGWSAFSQTTEYYAGELYGWRMYDRFGKYMGFPVRPQKD